MAIMILEKASGKAMVFRTRSYRETWCYFKTVLVLKIKDMNKKSPVKDWAKKHKGETSQILRLTYHLVVALL